MTTDIKDMALSLVAMIQPDPIEIAQTPRKPTACTMQVLPSPLEYTIQADYIGPSIRHLLAHTGDKVIVYAWTKNEKEAIAYNSRIDTIGCIPSDLLKKVESQHLIRPEICTPSTENPRDGVGKLTWKAGDHIFICRWEDSYKNKGTGFNLATTAYGRFSVSAGQLKVLRPGDT
jgi:hypothetical protein